MKFKYGIDSIIAVYCITEVQVLLLSDLLVLMEKNEDKDKNKYYLRCHTSVDAVKEKEEVREYLSIIMYP